MIKYNNLKVESGYLYIDIEVENETYFKDVLIKGVRIDTSMTYGTTVPYDTVNQTAGTKLTVKKNVSESTSQLFFITPIIQGNPSPDTPCNKDINNIGVVYDSRIVLNKGMVYLKELSSSCVTPKGFIDFILKIKALDMSIRTCNYNEAIKYWDMLKKTSVGATVNNCRCHGFN